MNERNDGGDRPDQQTHVDSEDGVRRSAILQPSAPISADDLRYALDELFTEQADELYADLVDGVGQPGVSWGLDILHSISRISPDHRRRIAEFLGMSYEELSAKVSEINAS